MSLFESGYECHDLSQVNHGWVYLGNRSLGVAKAFRSLKKAQTTQIPTLRSSIIELSLAQLPFV